MRKLSVFSQAGYAAHLSLKIGASLWWSPTPPTACDVFWAAYGKLQRLPVVPQIVVQRRGLLPQAVEGSSDQCIDQ
jgi:hypothetical protein